MDNQKTDVKKIALTESSRIKWFFIIPTISIIIILYYFGFVDEYPVGMNIFVLIMGFFIMFLTYNLVFLGKHFFNARHVSSSTSLFKTIGDERLVFRYNHILRYRNIAIRLTIYTAIVFGLFLGLTTVMTYDADSENKKTKYQITTIAIILTPGMFAYLLHMIKTSISWKYDFEYNYSKRCFMIIIQNNSIESVSKTKFLFSGLNSYNNYLGLELGRKINDLDKFALVLLGNSDVEFKFNLQKLYANFDEDTMAVLRYIRNKHPDFKLGKEIIPLKLKELLPIILAPIPIVVAIIQYMTK